MILYTMERWVFVVSVYNLQHLPFLVVSGAVEHGNHYTLKMMYEHILERTAYNMTYGPFGSVKSMPISFYFKNYHCIL